MYYIFAHLHRDVHVYIHVHERRVLVLLLTVIILRVRHSQSKGSQENDIHKVEEEVGKVEPGTKSVPLVVKEAGHQRMLEELTAIILHLK